MFIDPFQEKIWKDKYQYNNETFEEFCNRISSTIFPDDEKERNKLNTMLKEFKVLFGGRINSNIGIPEEGLTLFNCFIEAIVKEPDSLVGIMDMVTKYALTLKTEGGVGFCADFFRPAKTLIRKIGVTTPGAIKFLEIFDKVSEVITSGSVAKDDSFQGEPTKKSIRKGATMVTMSVSHPDIEEFITAKSVPNRLTKMNMSVLVTDEFIDAMKNDKDWDLWFPDINCEQYDPEWDGNLKRWKEKNYPIVVYKTVRAVELWDLIMKSTYNRSEPGILFIDNARRMNNLWYLDGDLISTNPCQPGWATVLTIDGIKTIDDININDKIWSEDGWVTVTNKFSTGIKDVFKYETDVSVFCGTEDHPVKSNGKKIEIDKAKTIDNLPCPLEPGFQPIKVGSYEIRQKEYVSTEEVFRLTVDGESHTYWTGGCNVFNCSEIFGHTGIENVNENNILLGDVCCLGSINITKFYDIAENKFCVEKFRDAIDIMIKALDNVIDISNYPLPMYEDAAKLKRKIGLGITGIGSLLMMMNMRYGSEESVDVLTAIMTEFANQAYKSSALLAKEKGAFTLWDSKAIKGGFIKNSGILRPEVIKLIENNGLRNSATMALAPNGTLSILAGNVSGGLEPVFATEFTRWNRVEGKQVDFEYPNIHKGEWFETDYFKEQKIADEVILMSKDGEYRVDKNNGLCKKITIKDYGYKLAKDVGHTEFATAMELSVDEHLNILKTLSLFIDQSSSKTINLPNSISFEDFKALYSKIHECGIKGCTTYREGTSVAVLEATKKEKTKSVRKQQKEFLAVFKDQESDDIIFEDVKLPEEYPAKGYVLKSENRKWYLSVAFKDKACSKPFAIFVNTNAREDNVVTYNALEKMEEIALHKGLKEEFIEETKRKYAYQKNPVKICRMLGLLLRHNIDVYSIVRGFDELDGAIPGTFVFRMKKFLGQFVEEHEVGGMVCPECGEKSIIFSEGCYVCKQCGGSKCS